MAQPATCDAAVTATHDNLVKKKVERTVVVRRLPSNNAAFYMSKMAIDADGAPNAYHPDDKKGLDAKANAGFPTSCNVMVCKVEGQPAKGYVQTPSGEFKDFFVSQSSLRDKTKDRTDFMMYVNADKIPYIAIPGSVAKKAGIALGDTAYVVNLKNGRQTAAIFADIGTEKTLGEGSIELARRLGVNSSPKTGGAGYQILYIAFSNTAAAPPWPRTFADVEAAGKAKFEAWGGMARVKACEPSAVVASVAGA
jgi:hypothetical protein